MRPRCRTRLAPLPPLRITRLAAASHSKSKHHWHLPQQDFSVYSGPSMDAVRAAYARRDRAWCGLPHLLHDSPNCTVAISPAGTTFVAVVKPKTWLGERARADV